MNGDQVTPASVHPSGSDPGEARRRRRSRWLLVGSVAGGISLLTALLGFGLTRDPTLIKSPRSEERRVGKECRL